MNWSRTWLLMALFAGAAQAQLQLLPDAQPLSVFGGATQIVNLHWHNSGNETVSVEIRTRIYQTSSATAVLVNDAAWKTLQALPEQTVLDTARLDFPAVKAETQFIVQWLEHTNRVIGTTEVWVYPTNLLAELKPMLGEATLGVLDPNDELKSLLKQNKVEFVDLGESALENFRGRLAILGPFRTKAQLPENIAPRVKAAATNGVAVLWLQPPPGPRDKLQPSYFTVMTGTNAVVVAQSSLVADLPNHPQSQLRLVQLCRQALHPEPAALPESNHQP